MNCIFPHKYSFLYFFMLFLLLLNSINFILCQGINHIIPLGDHPFTYARISFNSFGDMVVDTSAYYGNNKRRFFGLKKNGKYFFKDSSGLETPYFNMANDRQNSERRIEGESIFIKIGSYNPSTNGKEYLFGTAKKKDSYCEIYYFEENTFWAETTQALFGDIQSDVFSALKLPEETDSNFHYIFSFIEQKDDEEDKGYLTIRNIYFNSDSSNFYNSQLIKKIEVSKTNIVSSFFTENKKLVTFFHKDKKYKVIIFDESLSKDTESDICDVHDEKEDEDLNIFFKCIHFKGEIGAFIYFKTNNDPNPFFTLKEVNSKNKVEEYFKDDKTYTIDGDFYKNSKMNDLKKMNDYQICYVSTNEAKKKINIIIFNLYFEKIDMLIRYYSVEINDPNIIMLFNELTSGIYNNFITIAFSHCPQEPCYEPTDTHYTSIIIFNYPSSNDTTIDFVEQLYITDKNIQDDLFFDFINTMKIENNIFGYEYKGVSISNIPNDIYLKVDGNIINNKNILILKDQSISFSFHSNDVYLAENYSIEFAFVLTEPGYEELNSYCTKVDSLKGLSLSSRDTYSNVEYEKNDYIGKTSSFIISIKNELMTNCEDSFCSLCYSDNSRCITCKYNATFNEIGEKNCFRIDSPLTTILIPETTVQTTILIPETSYPILPVTESMKISTEEESIYIPPEVIPSTPLIYEPKIEKTIPISTITKQFDIENTIPISTIAKQYDTEKKQFQLCQKQK